MTVVAWDGRSLAADRLVSLDGYVYSITKIHRVDPDTLVGISGNPAAGFRFIDWLGGKETDDKDGGEFNALVIKRTPDGVRLYRYEDLYTPIPLHDRQHVLGVGGDYAAAVMHLGCNARKAVEVACALSELCGGGIDELTLEETPS